MAQPKLQRKVFATILGSLPTQAQNHPIRPPVEEMAQWSSEVKNFLAGYHAFHRLSTYDYGVQLFQYNQFSSLGKPVSLVANDEEGLMPSIIFLPDSNPATSRCIRYPTLCCHNHVFLLSSRKLRARVGCQILNVLRPCYRVCGWIPGLGGRIDVEKQRAYRSGFFPSTKSKLCWSG